MPEFMTAYTNAPESYDYSYVDTVETQAGEDYAGYNYRKILLPVDKFPYQAGRYRSGLYWVTDEAGLPTYT